jgi:hypothetical protein
VYEDRVLPVLNDDSGTQNAGQQFFSDIHLSFVNFTPRTIPQRNTERIYVWRFKYLFLGNYSKLDTFSYQILKITMTDTIDLSSKITLYNSVQWQYLRYLLLLRAIFNSVHYSVFGSTQRSVVPPNYHLSLAANGNLSFINL